MAVINNYVRTLFEHHKAGPKFFALATSSKKCIPNVVPIGFLWIAGNDEIWVVDNFLNKTLANIKENPVAAVYAMDGDNVKDCVQLKGKCTYVTSGPDYESAAEMARKANKGFPAKGLLKIKVDCAFDTSPGPSAGKKI